MAALWELGKEIESLADALEDATEEESEQILANWLKADADFDDKALNVSRYILQLNAIADAQKAEEQRIQALRKQNEARATKLKDYLNREMIRLGKTKIEGATGKIHLRKNPPVVSILTENIPPYYQRLTATPNLSLIKEAIKAGEIDWAEFQENGYSITLK